jgi:TolB-like protein
MMRFARFATSAAAALGLAAPVARAVAQETAKPTVAILFFNNNVFAKDARDYDGLRKGLADLLITEMAENPNIRLIDRDQAQRMFDAQKLAAGTHVDRELAVRVGKLLGAQHMIFGGYMADMQGNLRIDARAVGVERGVIEYTERMQDKGDNVMGLIGALADRLNAGMNLPAMPAGAQPAAAPGALPMKYALMYGRALDLSDHGDRTGAVELLGAVLKDFPAFEPAKKARARLTSGG